MPKYTSMRMATCHPELQYHCKGLCKKCYGDRMYAKRRTDPAYKAAAVVRSRAWAKANPERVYILDADKHLRSKYGISYSEYLAMLSKQNGTCALCRNQEEIIIKSRRTRLAVDHCHLTEKIRGLLCFRCNTSIALFEERPDLLDKVKEYLSA